MGMAAIRCSSSEGATCFQDLAEWEKGRVAHSRLLVPFRSGEGMRVTAVLHTKDCSHDRIGRVGDAVDSGLVSGLFFKDVGSIGLGLTTVVAWATQRERR